MIDENRSLVLYILLSIITCGFYNLYFVYKLAKDVNQICDGDGQTTSGLLLYILLSIITCSFYSWYWFYKVGNRMQNKALDYGLYLQENGTTILLLMVVGMFTMGIGFYVAIYFVIKNINDLSKAYNENRHQDVRFSIEG